jgi:hypothetical protein
MSGSNFTPSSWHSSITSLRIIFACRSSITVEMSGNMMRIGPRALARRSARNCVRNMGMF